MTTPNLGLSVTTLASGSATKFQDWRLGIDGDTASDMQILDAWAGQVSGSITTLQAGAIYTVSAAEYTTNNYVATVSGITAYNTNLIINLIVDVTTTGTTTLNINSLGAKSLYKIASNGVAGNLTTGDLVAGRAHFFIYTGTYWLWIDGTSADQINITGNPNEIAILSGSGIASSGISASSLALTSGCYVVLSLNSNLNNEFLLSAGSATAVNTNTAASTVRIDVQATSPIVASGSSLTHATSGVTAATYNLSSVTVDAMGHVTSASSGIFATPAQVSSGSSATAVVSASSLAYSNYGTKTGEILLNTSTALAGTEKNYIRIPSFMNGWKLVDVAAACSGSSTSGSPAFILYRSSASATTLVNMLTTNVSIDQGEYDSSTSSASAVISTVNNIVYTGDKIWAYSASASACGTGVTYASVSPTFQNRP